MLDRFFTSAPIFLIALAVSVGPLFALNLNDSSVEFKQQKLRMEIDQAHKKGVGTAPFQAGLAAAARDLQNGVPSEQIDRRLAFLLRALNAQMESLKHPIHAVHTRVETEGAGDEAQSGSSTQCACRGAAFSMDKFVYTVKAAYGVKDVSPEFLSEVKSIIRTIPEKLLAQLQCRGGRVCVAPRLADKMPGFRNTHPRGWLDGFTGKNVDGLFDGRELIVCEYNTSYSDDSVLEKSNRAPYLTRHEMGHAFDHYWDRISQSDEFKHTYYLELAKMDPSQRDGELAYFAQKAEGGPSECFAELFAIMMGGGCLKADDAALSALFPQCMKLIRKKLEF